MRVRTETATDIDAVRAVLIDAFESPDEALLVDLIRQSDRFVQDLSIVAEVEGIVVGHILFSYVDLVGDKTRRVLSLAPLAVAQQAQLRGVGRALVEDGLARCDRRGEPLVVVEGIPAYYPRFGFRPAADYGIEKPAHEVPDEAFMVCPLNNHDPQYRGRLVYPPAFHEANAIGP
jgi:putative acetyltransferase